jgi:nucleoside 2-deoxyribosyltransferase
MMRAITVYLAGKVGPTKWGMVKGVVGAQFVSSDGSAHSEHDWGFGCWAFTDPNLQCQLRTSFIEQIQHCDCVVAFLTDPTCFGGIAEIAYASALGVKCYMILTTGIPSGEDGEEEPFQGKMRDAYWFISNFPNVRAFEVTTESEARQITQAIVEAHIAPENATEILGSADIAHFGGRRQP